MSTVHVIVPEGIDDPNRPSGGNRYDRRVLAELAAAGWTVREHLVPGAWPRPDDPARRTLAAVVGALPDRSLVLVDGLVGSAVPDVLVPHATRLRLAVLVHMPLGALPGADHDDCARERAVLASAVAVVVTSSWTEQQVRELYALSGDAVHVAEPGVDRAELAPGTADGSELLCVAAVTPGKGQDVLAAALATIRDLTWHCRLVGSLDRAPDFVRQVRRQVRDSGLERRVCFAGPQTGAELDRSYAGADVLVLASRGETYGMVVTEALARGLPVVAAAVGGVPAALGQGPDGRPPGLLVPPDDPAALATALRRWLEDDELRRQLRRSARARRASLSGWAATAERVSRVLSEAAA